MRSAGRTTRRPRGPGAATIDTHAHWYPKELISLLEQGAAAHGASMGRTPKGHPVFSLPGLEPKSVMRPSMVEPELILKAMDRRRVDAYALSLTNPMVYWPEAGFGLKLAQAWNDACAAVHASWPQRFIGTIMLPMQAPELAVRELDRAAKLPGLRAVYLATHINGKNLDEPEFRPVYARCEALGLPIFLHPLYPCGGSRIARHFMRNLCGNPYETGLAAASLVLGGVLDEFPKLTVMLPQAGGAFPWLAGRFDRGWKVRQELAHMKRRPTHYLRRFYYDTITHHPDVLRFLIELVGADRVVLGSDYDQDMSYERPVEVVERLPGLTRAEREMILGGNARRLLRL
jgi:aminocarboxymuconate-semialdehyde decarboxylase